MQALIDKINSVFASRRFTVITLCLITGLVLIAYSNTFTSSFHFDDHPSIVDNPTIKRVTGDNLASILMGNRPVVYLSLMLNYSLGGLNVTGYHIFNIAVHIANSMFVFLLMLWTLNLPALEAAYRAKAGRMALFGALLFAVHPIQTESVTYIITRTELLATFFYLATFLLFFKGATRNNFLYYVGAGVTAFLAAGSKEWAVTLPALLAIYDFLFLARGDMKAVAARWKAYALVLLSWLMIYHLLHTTFESAGQNASIGFNVSTTSGITTKTYFLTSLNVLWTYLRLLVLPIKQNLDYDYPIAKTLFEFPTILSFIGHLAVLIAAVWLYRRKGWLLIPFGVAWFYIGISPVQSIVPIIDIIFEHRAYMPSIGFFIIFVTAWEGLFDWWERRRTEKPHVTA